MTAKTKSAYYHVTDGEWITVSKRGYKEQCCDCGLVHTMNFRVNAKGQIEVQSFRDGKATGGARKGFKFTKEAE